MRRRATVLLLLFPLIALAGCPKQRAAPPRGAKLVGSGGEVSCRRAGSTAWEPVSQGMSLSPLDALKTGGHSWARLELTRGGLKVELSIDEQSLVVVAPPGPQPSAPAGSGLGPRPAQPAPFAPVAGLEQGTLRSVSKKGVDADVLLPDGRSVRIVPDKEVAYFRMRVVADGKVEIAVLNDTAQILLGGASPVRLRAPDAAVLVRGGRLGEGSPLADPPNILAPGKDAKVKAGAPLTLHWMFIQRASRYRVQVCESRTFDRCIVDDRTTTVPGLKLPALPAGKTYFVRASSFDAAGREGEFGEPSRFTVVAGGAPSQPASQPASRPK
jgi:hypothetical protein